jgi:hypothetical protein
MVAGRQSSSLIGHTLGRDVVPRTSDRNLSTRSTTFSLRSSRPRGLR